MSKMTILSNGKVTAVFLKEDAKLSLTYFTVDGEVIKSAWITKEAGNNVYRKLRTTGYQMMAQMARA